MIFLIPLSKNAGDPPLQRQIYSAFRKQILTGSWTAGDTLPSTRELALQLGLSRTTTNAAYEQLLAEGFIVSRRGSRAVVAEGVAAGPVPRRETDIRLSRFGEAALEAGIEAPSRKGKQLPYDFVYGRSAVAAFPFETWRRLLLQSARKATLKSLDYGAAAGDLELREAIAAHLRRSRAVVCDASQILILNGSQQGLDLCARVMLNPGDGVVLEDPSYQGARDVFRAAGARLYPIPVDHKGIVPALFPAEGVRLVFTTPSHQFPTGVILPLQRRRELIEWARQRGAVIVEDDYDGEFHYAGQPVESMQGLDTEGRVLYMGTFSRTIFPSLRIGYLVVPKTLMPAFTAAKWLTDRHTAALEQQALAAFLATGAYERHLRRVRKLNAAKLDALLAAIEKHLPHLKVTGEKSGTHLCLWTKADEDAVVQKAAGRGVGVYGIRGYYAEPPGAKTKGGGILLGFSRMEERDIREGIRRLAETGI